MDSQRATSTFCPVRWRQGLKRKNLKLQGWNLNFFFTGGKPEFTQITGGKNILIFFLLPCWHKMFTKLTHLLDKFFYFSLPIKVMLCVSVTYMCTSNRKINIEHFLNEMANKLRAL